MTLFNQNWLTFGGKPITGRTPTGLNTNQPLTQAQQGAVAHAFKLFCDAVKVSSFPDGYHLQHRTLVDGTAVRMESNAGVQRVWVIAPKTYEETTLRNGVCMFVAPEMPMSMHWWAGSVGENTETFSSNWFTFFPHPNGAPSIITDKVGSVFKAPQIRSNRPYVAPTFKHGVKSLFTAAPAEGITVGSREGNYNQSYPGNTDWSDRRLVGATPATAKPPAYDTWRVLTWWANTNGRYGKYNYAFMGGLVKLTVADSDPFPIMGPDRFGLAPTSAVMTDPARYIQSEDMQEASRIVWCNGVAVAMVPVGEMVLAACFYEDSVSHSRFIHIVSQTRGYPTTPAVKCYWVRTTISAAPKNKPSRYSSVFLIGGDREGELWGVRWTKYIAQFLPLGPRGLHCNSAGTKAITIAAIPLLDAARGADLSSDQFAVLEINLITGDVTAVAGVPATNAILLAADYRAPTDTPTFLYATAPKNSGSLQVYHVVEGVATMIHTETHADNTRYTAWAFGDLRVGAFDIQVSSTWWVFNGIYSWDYGSWSTRKMFVREQQIEGDSGGGINTFNQAGGPTGQYSLDTGLPNPLTHESYATTVCPQFPPATASSGYTSSPDNKIAFRSMGYPDLSYPKVRTGNFYTPWDYYSFALDPVRGIGDFTEYDGDLARTSWRTL